MNYIRSLNIDEPLTRIKSDGTIRHYVTDALGSVIALTDDTGTVRTIYTYDPFGNVTVSGESSDNPFQYTGRENDGTGLYYYRARYYSPELQRFISEDPIGLAGGDINIYSYVHSNPVNYVDPLGLQGGHPLVGMSKSPYYWYYQPEPDVKPVIELGKFLSTIGRGLSPIIRLFTNPKSPIPIVPFDPQKLLEPSTVEAAPYPTPCK